MFDPTIYENVKVMLEGAVYDLDLAGAIHVAGREDLADLAMLSRTYRITFHLKEPPGRYSATLELSSSLQMLAAEILEQSDGEAGCSIGISFSGLHHSLAEAKEACAAAEAELGAVWGGRCQVEQFLTETYGSPLDVRHTVRLSFGRTFTEAVAEDIPSLVDHTVLSLEHLN